MEKKINRGNIFNEKDQEQINEYLTDISIITQ